MTTINLEAKSYTSKVLQSWAHGRSGALQRMGVRNASNGVTVAETSDSAAMRELFAPMGSASGFAVTDKTAMAVSTVYACLSKLAGAITQLPLHHYRRLPNGSRERVTDSALWWLLNESPDSMWTSASWKEWIVRCVALRGDSHARIIRGPAAQGGIIKGFEPLHPDFVHPRVVIGEGRALRVVYDCLDRFTGEVRTVDQDDMLHFAGLGFDGLRSTSVIKQVAKQAIGNSLAAAEYSGRTVGEGAMPQIALTTQKQMNEKQAELLRNSFIATYTGPDKRKIPLVLTEGLDFKTLNISPVDLELIASRRYEKEDICQAMGVPPVLIGENDKTSSWGTGIEQITLGFVKFTIKPMLVRWEEELNRKIFTNAGPYLEHELDGLLRGDSKAQSEVFKAALGGPGTGDGYMTVNEVRKLKNMPPLDGGNELYKAQRGTDAAPSRKA